MERIDQGEYEALLDFGQFRHSYGALVQLAIVGVRFEDPINKLFDILRGHFLQ
tara:strand:+ start:1956 stop:2114 length:159 start_codon:yes stop_codon:yes gene_type:complete